VNGYLIPANSKKGNLILNIFRPFDIIMFVIGAFVSLMMFVIVQSDNTVMILISCLPVGITGLLVVPIPNYHNVLCAIQSILNFYNNKRRFVWRGWCFNEYFKEENSSK